MEALSNQFPKPKIEIWFEDKAKLGAPAQLSSGSSEKRKAAKST
ncbi:hypothetical protein NEOC65_000142 [Neochlamydia sp. AcF65]|nr:hypothetical protein [Neochlamydia sp. AcF65]